LLRAQESGHAAIMKKLATALTFIVIAFILVGCFKGLGIPKI